MADLKAPSPSGFHSLQFSKRAAGWLQGEPSPLSKDGKVLKVVGIATFEGKPIKRGQTLPTGASSIKTGPLSQVMFLPVPGVIAEVQENSEIVFEQTSDRFEKGILQSAQTRLKTVSGDVHFAIADGFGDKIRVEVSTPKGLLKAQSTAPGYQPQSKQATTK
jgi:hypothetical protein